MRHINIPIFIPHLGCPNQCIFCNQRHISGTLEFREQQVKEDIDKILNSLSGEFECEIAFFGGSFTGIDKELMIRLLDLAQSYVDSGLVVGIRMSTRPDYINDEIVKILKQYTVTFVELGIQSMNDEILSYLKRGHTANDTIVATRILKQNGIRFIGQMMVGLPLATIDDEIYCAEQICSLGASGARIYPTLVFKATELEEMAANGTYIPLSVDEAVERCASVLEVFEQNGVECIRIGLCDSDNLHSSDTFVSGPNEPAIGEMVKSRYYYNQICHEIVDEMINSNSIVISCQKGLTSQIVGHKKINIEKLKQKFNFKKIIIKENLSHSDTKYKFKVKEENS